MWPRKYPKADPIVLKNSHFRTPRMLRDAQFEPSRPFDPEDRFVFKGYAVCAAIGALLYLIVKFS